MTRTPKLVVYAALAACLFLLALVLGIPELAALGAPFALLLVVGLAAPRPAAVRASLAVEVERTLEGEAIPVEVVLSAPSAVPALHVALALPTQFNVVGAETRWLVRLGAGRQRRLPLELACTRWGAYRLGDITWRSGDAAGLRVVDGRTRGDRIVRVFPGAETLRAAVNPLETQPFAGNRTARSRGDGVEFADVRPYAPGDRPRRVNWRATSLRQTLHVNEQHQERNSDVIIFVDSFAEARLEGEGTLDLAVRAATSLAAHYLAARDRVGFVAFGGVVRWLTPAGGAIQRYRMFEALLETQVALSAAWKDIDVLPARALTPQALVVALTPLLDDRGIAALLDLRRRGFDLVVLEIPPLAFVPGGSSLDVLAGRFWRLRRDAIRFRFDQLGVAVVPWDGKAPLAATLEEVRRFRRFVRYTSG